MSVSSLPEWKQLLLEKKRREEEERERRGKEEEEKLASMPAWKRGIIQRRKARQESFGDREKDRDVCLLQVDGRSPSDGLSDTDSSVTANLGSDPSLSPDPGQWLDVEPKSASQVSVETIVPVHENPFIRTQNVWRKGRDSGEAGNDLDTKEKEKLSPRDQDVETRRGRDIEMKIERFRDLSEGWEKEKIRDRSLGREKENSREGCEKDKYQWKDSVKDTVKEQEFFKIRKDTDEKEPHPPSGPFSPLVPCLRTIRADNIIIIEQDRKSSDDRKGKWREPDREKTDEDQLGKRGMKMDLREILAGGGSVTEIRATEVLIIKPSANPEELSTGGKGREDGELKTSMGLRRESVGKELRTDISWVREKEKERPWGQATVINKDERKDSIDDNVFVERGGRVSQLLSKFGEHPKPPSRSKSSDNFLQSGRRKYSGDHDRQSEERKTYGKNMLLKNIPKRSFSFSDRVIGDEENGLDDKECQEKIHIDSTVAPWADMADMEKDTTAKLKVGWARLLDKDRFGKHRDIKAEDERGGAMGRRNEADMWIKHRNDVKRAEPVYTKSAEKVSDRDEDKGFTVASVKNTEGISFARRVPIRQDGKARSEREMKRLTGAKSWENVEKDSEAGGHAEAHATDKVDLRREDELECIIQDEVSEAIPASAESLSSSQDLESQHRHDSAFTESSNLLSVVTDRVPHRRPEWSGTGPQGPYLTRSVLSPHTEDLISKIEKLGDSTVYLSERGERANKAGHENPKESKEEVETRSDSGSEGLIPSITPRSPERIAAIGTLPAPLDIQIPRTVFYVAEEMLERKKAEGQSSNGQDWEGGQGVERRDSWRIGKPLSRIESLREKIRQRELENQRQSEVHDGDEGAVVDVCNTQTLNDRYDERERDQEKKWESLAYMQKRSTEAERTQEEAAQQTSITASDVTQEVAVLKTFPQLPVSVPHLQAERGEEVANEYATVASEIIADCFQITENEDDPCKHVEDQLRLHKVQPESREEEEEEEEQNKFSEEEEEEYASSVNSSQSLSPSPPHPNSLAAMSRIYNLDTVGSRSGLCLKDRTVDMSSSVNLVKVKPLISNLQQGDSKAPNVDDISGVQTIKQQIEQFQLKEQEVLNSSASSNTVLRDRETKGHQSPKGLLKQKLKDNEETPETKPKLSPQRICPSPSQLKQTITITPSLLRSQSSDNSLKPTNCVPTPASSPSSPSPAHSPSISPSPNPSPTLFTIKSASGGRVKRGATITITPKKPAATGSSVQPLTTGSTKAPPQQATPAVAEPMKKKYPTAEEIEVIGGYQNLERSCLVKNRGTPKRGKVCFDEDQLEQVCEYPSETFMLTLSPLPADLVKMEKLQGEEAQEEEGEVEGGPVLFKSTRNTGIATGPRLRVDESCPR